MSVFKHPAASLQLKPWAKPLSTGRPDRMKSNAALSGFSRKLAGLREEFYLNENNVQQLNAIGLHLK